MELYLHISIHIEGTDSINSVINTDHSLARYSDGFSATSTSKVSHPKVLRLESWDTVVRCTDLCQEIEERVQIVQSLDALVQRGHHGVSVLCQFHAVRLFLARAQFAELLEQIKKFLMLFEQPETKEVGDEGKFSLKKAGPLQA